MTKLNEIYKCEVCGNIVEVVHASIGELVCCGQPMKLLVENTVDAATEKHIPIIEKSDSTITVKVGSVPHPMIPEHYIEFIELIADGRVYKKFLNPVDNPEAVFEVTAEKIGAREYCNLHGLWSGK